MSEKQIQANQRRKLLKSVVLGGGVLGAAQALPEKWLTPVVNSVVLPAHAETTDTGSLPVEEALDKYYLMEDESQASRACSELATQAPSVLETLGVALLPEAHASDPWVYRHYLEHLGNNVYKYIHLATQGGGLPYNKLYVEGTLGVQDPKDFPTYSCGGNGFTTQVEIVSVTPGVTAEVKIDDGCGGTYVLPIDPNAVAPTNVACD